MTREEAIGYGTGWLKDEYLDAKDRAFIKTALEVLEQEPMLNKIRAEIEDIYCGQYCEDPLTAGAVKEMALEIIYKYMVESEEDG